MMKLRAHAITFTWPRNSFTCARNNCPIKIIVIAAIITSFLIGQLLSAHVKVTACARKAIAWPRKRYCVRT